MTACEPAAFRRRAVARRRLARHRAAQRRALGDSRPDESERGRNDGAGGPASETRLDAGEKSRPRARAARRRHRPVHGYRRRSGCDRRSSRSIPIPSIRLLEQSGRADLILKIWHHTFSAMGLLECLICRNMATAFAWRGWPTCSMPSRRSRMAATHFGGRDRLQRQGQHGGVLRRHRPRLWLAHRPVHLAASLSLQRTLPGSTAPRSAMTNWRGWWRGSKPPSPTVSQRRGEQFGAFEALFALACLHFQESECDFAVFEAGIGGRYDPVRLVGARFTCVTSVDYEHVELLGNSLELIVSDKSDACASGGTIIYGENCRKLRPHLLEYNRHREIAALFVRDQIGIGGETVSASGQRFDFRFGELDFRALDIEPARRVPVQQRRDCDRAVPALAADASGPQGCRRHRSRRAIGPARHAMARPARGHRA